MMMDGKVQRVPASPSWLSKRRFPLSKNALHALVREGYLEKIGAGRSTAYLCK